MSNALAQLLLQTFREQGVSDEKIKQICAVLRKPEPQHTEPVFVPIDLSAFPFSVSRALQAACLTSLIDAQVYSENELSHISPRIMPELKRQLDAQGYRLRHPHEPIVERAFATHGSARRLPVSYMINTQGVRLKGSPPIASCQTYTKILESKGFAVLGDFHGAPAGKVREVLGQAAVITWLEGLGIHPSSA